MSIGVADEREQLRGLKTVYCIWEYLGASLTHRRTLAALCTALLHWVAVLVLDVTCCLIAFLSLAVFTKSSETPAATAL